MYEYKKRAYQGLGLGFLLMVVSGFILYYSGNTNQTIIQLIIFIIYITGFLLYTGSTCLLAEVKGVNWKWGLFLFAPSIVGVIYLFLLKDSTQEKNHKIKQAK